MALAVPAPAARALAEPLFPQVAALLGRIAVRTVKSLGLVVADPLPRLPRLAGLILPGGPCFSAVVRIALAVIASASSQLTRTNGSLPRRWRFVSPPRLAR